MLPERGVYFRREDYASFWRRLLVGLIDTIVYLVLSLILSIPLAFVSLSSQATLNLILLIWVIVALFYFVILKRSPFRTIGYLFGGVRVVGLDGQPPDYSSMILRWMFALLSPLNCVDLFWMSHDAHRQALHDKFAGTYVVKSKAQPAGQGRIVFHHYEILQYICMFREVKAESIASHAD